MVHYCKICGKTFEYKHVLERHEMTHIGKKGFKCSLCGKAFGRKDALVRHMKSRQHRLSSPQTTTTTTTTTTDPLPHVSSPAASSSTSMTNTKSSEFRCTWCTKVFGSVTGLKKHSEVCIQKPSTSEEEPKQKRKRTDAYDEIIKDGVTLRRMHRQESKKFSMKTDVFKATLNMPDDDEPSNDTQDDQPPEISTLIRNSINTIMEGIFEMMGATDRDHMRLSIEHPDLNGNINFPLMNVRELSLEFIVDTIGKVLQSHESLDVNGIIFHCIFIRLPEGGGYKKRVSVNLENFTKTKRSIVRIINPDDEICLARALVVGKALADNNPAYDQLRHPEKCAQQTAAIQLHHEANVPVGLCGLGELDKFCKTVLKQYHVIVVTGDNVSYRYLYENGKPDCERHIILLYSDNHFDVIKSMTAFTCKSYYCFKCRRGFKSLENDKCKNICSLCLGIDCVKQPGVFYCARCRIYFKNESCFLQHTTRKNKFGSVMCDRKARCPGVFYCARCRIYFKNESCFLQHTTRKNKFGSVMCDRKARCLSCKKIVARNQLDDHNCGLNFCKSCGKDMPLDHLCYMQLVTKKSNDDDDDEKVAEKSTEFVLEKKLISFDFETMTVDGTHRVILAFAHRTCGTCALTKRTADSTCSDCGKNEHIFTSDTSFCEWLFSEENRGSLVFAHNFMSFDGYFVLRFLVNQGILPEVIPNGGKIMSMYVKHLNMQFLDTLNFLPMKLAKLPSTLGLIELKKGYFPYLFCREETLNYSGPVPESKYYNPDGMSENDRQQFLKWHAEQLEKHFDMQTELVEYCRSDVDILMQSVVKFQELFYSITSVDPFDGCITIAAACNLALRSRFLKPDTIGLIPPGGYKPNAKYSKMAVRWLKWLAVEKNLDIKHVLNGGEVTLGKFKVDGFHEKTRTVYGFNGCYFHGCPECFPVRGDPVACNRGGRTFDDVYQATLRRKHELETMGYTVVQMWEHDYNRKIRDDVNFKSFVERVTVFDPLEPRKCFYGGRTNAIKLHHKIVDDEKISYIDICSLYPYVNSRCSYPIGHPDVITENFSSDISEYYGLIKCSILPPRGLFLPVLPYRSGGKLTFPLCATCANTCNQHDVCTHNETERVLGYARGGESHKFGL
ncbi:uncharacterized protein LOC141913858 [Tubulanus polymorphus]|uniref:uncharacterized protein LOC141913858 n=1 Tax=Tubulanus polymorphus TaxID=672921 RepID=UPI003DA467BA